MCNIVNLIYFIHDLVWAWFQLGIAVIPSSTWSFPVKGRFGAGLLQYDCRLTRHSPRHYENPGQHLVLYARAESFRSAFRARLLPEGDGRLLDFSMASCRSWVPLVSLNLLESSVIILSRSYHIRVHTDVIDCKQGFSKTLGWLPFLVHLSSYLSQNLQRQSEHLDEHFYGKKN